MLLSTYLLIIGISVLLIAGGYLLFKNKSALRIEHLEPIQPLHEQRVSNRRQEDNVLGWQFFEDRVKQNIKECERYQFTMGVLLIDIDDFNIINDALGFEMGDLLLNQVADALQSCIRQVDSVSRYTKDVFAVLLTQLNKPETAAIVAQRILHALAQPFQVKEQELYITACIGIAIYSSDGKDASTLLMNAEHAVRLAKSKAKHSYQFHLEKFNVDSKRELALTTGLRRENVLKELAIYYQPIMNTQKEAIFCMDALLCWQHPTFGLINSTDLFHYAERQGKLNEFSEWLLRGACKQYLHWHSLGFYAECISIPVSVKQLESSHFILHISKILQELKFKPENLLLEIKGVSAQMSFDILEKAFNMLNYLGVKLALDNFGADSCSLTYLKNFKLDYLKLDTALISDLENNSQTVRLIKSLIEMTNNLGMQLIVKGIESHEQVSILKELNCVLMQGQLLGAPMTEKEINVSA